MLLWQIRQFLHCFYAIFTLISRNLQSVMPMTAAVDGRTVSDRYICSDYYRCLCINGATRFGPNQRISPDFPSNLLLINLFSWLNLRLLLFVFVALHLAGKQVHPECRFNKRRVFGEGTVREKMPPAITHNIIALVDVGFCHTLVEMLGRGFLPYPGRDARASMQRYKRPGRTRPCGNGAQCHKPHPHWAPQ